MFQFVRGIAVMVCDTALWAIPLCCLMRPEDVTTVAAVGVAASAFATCLVLLFSVVADILAA